MGIGMAGDDWRSNNGQELGEGAEMAFSRKKSTPGSWKCKPQQALSGAPPLELSKAVGEQSEKSSIESAENGSNEEKGKKEWRIAPRPEVYEQGKRKENDVPRRSAEMENSGGDR